MFLQVLFGFLGKVATNEALLKIAADAIVGKAGDIVNSTRASPVGDSKQAIETIGQFAAQAVTTIGTEMTIGKRKQLFVSAFENEYARLLQEKKTE